MLRVPRFLVTAALLAEMPPEARAQGPHAVSVETRAGIFLPATDLGIVGVTRGRLAAQPVLALTLTHSPPAIRPLSLEISAAGSFHGRTRFAPTATCTGWCMPATVTEGTFRVVTVAVRIGAERPGTFLAAAIGGGLRWHHDPDLVCACDPVGPTEFNVLPFLQGDSAPVGQLSATVGQQIGGIWSLLRLDGYWGSSRWRGQREFLITIGARW